MTLADLSDQTFQTVVDNNQRPTLLVFMSEWCSTCKEMTPTVEAVATEYGDRLPVYRVDFDENTDAAVASGVMVVPTVVLYKGGLILERLAGLQSHDKLVEKISKHLG